eukprot:TRINITY_DN4089_c0_g1_i1.p2 TRINITY_DN4089_c0_g1~~TRINITY_DN4089_c0_g1_i1.p2  ORF type:complete len:223 (-),score=48.69 TRINITY_DN4089_c0_g1_i1:403-1071(-)
MLSTSSLKTRFVRPLEGRTSSCRNRVSRVSVIKAVYPNKEFIQATLDAFNSGEKAIANVEEARALFSDGGYTFLDIRPTLEVDMIGKLRNSVTVPYKIAKKRFEAGEMIITTKPNENFLAEVNKKIPNKETPIIVCDTNGKKYALEVLGLLEDDDYTNLVGLRGGFFAWYRTWDNKLNRRVFQEYTTNDAANGDAMGIHTTGVGFERMDKSGMEAWQMFLDM